MRTKLYQYLFSVKALHDDLSATYTEQFGIPIEVRTRKTSALNATAKPDKLVVTIPDSINFTDPQTDFEKKCLVTLNDYVANAVQEFGKMYKEGKGNEQLTSTGDMRGMVSDWARKMDLPTPDLRFADDTKRLGYFRGSDGGSGLMQLSNLLRFIPPELSEEVVVHELCHAKVWNDLFNTYGIRQAAQITNRQAEHPKEFWDYFDKYMPDHKEKDDKAQALVQSLYNTKVEDD